MSEYRTLTEVEAVEYAKNIGIFPEDAELHSKEIGDGNLNYVFRIYDQKDEKKSIIFKQAVPYAKVVGESWPLTLERARIESEALIHQGELCPNLVPKVYKYDADLALTVMEDLSDHIILRTGLIERKKYPHFAEHISEFLARTLFFTTDIALGGEKKKELSANYINPELCKITEDLVFTDPFYDAPNNNINPALQDFIKKIWENQELRKEAAILKEGFMTKAQALLHGDLHTGSIFVTETSTKVIDPEFAFFGPIGFDIGAVIANLILNYAGQHGLTADTAEREEYRAYLLETVIKIWNVFKEKFSSLWDEHAVDLTAKIPGYKEDYLQRVFEDTLGYAGCKIMRRIVGLSHVKDIDAIEDLHVRAEAQILAFTIGMEFVLKRKEIQSIEEVVGLVKAFTK